MGRAVRGGRTDSGAGSPSPGPPLSWHQVSQGKSGAGRRGTTSHTCLRSPGGTSPRLPAPSLLTPVPRPSSASAGAWQHSARGRSGRLWTLCPSPQPFHLLGMGLRGKGGFSNCAEGPRPPGWLEELASLRGALLHSPPQQTFPGKPGRGPLGTAERAPAHPSPAEPGAGSGLGTGPACAAASPSLLLAPAASSWATSPSRGPTWRRWSGAWGACAPCTPRC